MGGLAVEVVFEAEGFPMEAVLLVPNALDGRADGRFDLFLRARCPCAIFIDALAADFAGEDDKLGRGQGFAGDAGFGVFRQEEIDDGVGNLVGDLVGMAFGHGFRGEEKLIAHGTPIECWGGKRHKE